MSRQVQEAPPINAVAIPTDVTALARITPAFRPHTEQAKNQIEEALRVSAEWALKHTQLVSDDAVRIAEASRRFLAANQAFKSAEISAAGRRLRAPSPRRNMAHAKTGAPNGQ